MELWVELVEARAGPPGRSSGITLYLHAHEETALGTMQPCRGLCMRRA